MSRTVQQPAVRLVLRDHQGQIVFEASRYPSLDAGEQTLLTFAAPGTLWPSWYDMEVWVSLGGDEVLLTSGILKVEGDTLYLPAVRR